MTNQKLFTTAEFLYTASRFSVESGQEYRGKTVICHIHGSNIPIYLLYYLGKKKKKRKKVKLDKYTKLCMALLLILDSVTFEHVMDKNSIFSDMIIVTFPRTHLSISLEG